MAKASRSSDFAGLSQSILRYANRGAACGEFLAWVADALVPQPRCDALELWARDLSQAYRWEFAVHPKPASRFVVLPRRSAAGIRRDGASLPGGGAGPCGLRGGRRSLLDRRVEGSVRVAAADGVSRGRWHGRTAGPEADRARPHDEAGSGILRVDRRDGRPGTRQPDVDRPPMGLPGAGIGMSHGGTIAVESAPGKGTRMEVRRPVRVNGKGGAR